MKSLKNNKKVAEKMSESLEEYCRRAIKEELSVRFAVPDVDLRWESMRLLSKRTELELTDDLLKLENQKFKVTGESLRQRAEELKRKEENQREAKLRHQKMNDVKQSLLQKKVETERAEAIETEHKLQRLRTDVAALLDKKENLQCRVPGYSIFPDFLRSVVAMTEFRSIRELVDRLEALASTRERLLKRQREAERARQRQSSELERYVSEGRLQLLQRKNALTDLQADLENAEEQRFREECAWNRIVTVATENTLLLGQIKFVTLNLYRMTGGVTGGKRCVRVDDTAEQLSRIQRYIRDRTDVIRYLEDGQQSGYSNPGVEGTMELNAVEHFVETLKRSIYSKKKE